MTNQHSSTMWVQSTHVAGKVRLLDPLDRPEEVKTVVSWMLEWKIWVFFLGWTVLPSGFLLPLLWPASFFSCLKRMKNEIYIYILSDVFFGNCWCCLCLLMFHPIYKWVMFCFYACNYMVRDRNRLSLRMVQNEGDMEWHWRHYSGIIRMKHVSRFSIFRLREQCDENKCWDWTSNHLLAFSSTLLNLK